MGRLSALVGMSILILLMAGCSDDTSREEPIDVNVKLAAVTKERDQAQTELKKEREAEVNQLARFESAETAATTGNDELRRQLNTVNRQLADAQVELKKARKEIAALKRGRAEGGHAAKEGDVAQ